MISAIFVILFWSLCKSTDFVNMHIKIIKLFFTHLVDVYSVSNVQQIYWLIESAPYYIAAMKINYGTTLFLELQKTSRTFLILLLPA